MSCVFHGYGTNPDACAIAGRCQQACGKPEDTTCPHGGEGEKCALIKEKVVAAHDA